MAKKSIGAITKRAKQIRSSAGMTEKTVKTYKMTWQQALKQAGKEAKASKGRGR